MPAKIPDVQTGHDVRQHQLSSEFFRERDLTRQTKPLCSLLRAASALPAATEDLGVLQTHERSAAGLVRTCQAKVVTLRALIADARAGHVMAIEHASKRVLAAARAGKPVPRTMADRSQLDACESALAIAQAELGQAIAGHQAAESDLAAGQRRLAGANVAAASLVVAMNLRNFADSVI